MVDSRRAFTTYDSRHGYQPVKYGMHVDAYTLNIYCMYKKIKLVDTVIIVLTVCKYAVTHSTTRTI